MLEQLESILNANKKIRLKIYSLEYVVELVNETYIMYQEQYPTKNNTSKTLQDLLSNYYIYNENLISNLDRIKILE